MQSLSREVGKVQFSSERIDRQRVDSGILGWREKIDYHFDVGTVEIGSHYLVSAIIRPIHFSGARIQRKSGWTVYICNGPQDLDIGAVKICAADCGRIEIGPVHFAGQRIESDCTDTAQRAGNQI